MPSRDLLVLMAMFGIAGFGITEYSMDTDAKTFVSILSKGYGTKVSKDEVDAYAKKRFHSLDADGGHTLDDKELRGRLTRAGLWESDDGKAVDEKTFVGFADKLFDAADTKGAKTLDVTQLRTPAGERLIELLE